MTRCANVFGAGMTASYRITQPVGFIINVSEVRK